MGHTPSKKPNLHLFFISPRSFLGIGFLTGLIYYLIRFTLIPKTALRTSPLLPLPQVEEGGKISNGCFAATSSPQNSQPTKLPPPRKRGGVRGRGKIIKHSVPKKSTLEKIKKGQCL
jgi:hypothetical protein